MPESDERPDPIEKNGRLPTNQGNVRLIDIQMVWDVVVEIRLRPWGARVRVADRHGVTRSTITEAVRRFEDAVGVRLLPQGERTDAEGLTAAGHAFSRHGKTFLDSYQILQRFLREAEENERYDRDV